MFTLLTIPWFKLEGWTIPGTPLGIQPFGILVAIGVIAGMRLAAWYGARNGVRAEAVSDCAVHVVLIGFACAHVFDVVAYHPELVWEQPWRLLYFWENLSSYGGVFGSALGGFYWAHKRKVPLLPVYDCIGFGFPLGWIFGRLGCFVVHDHPGRVTDFFLAVENYQYPGLPVATRHDLGFYEVLWSVAVLCLFLWLSRRPRAWGFYTGWFAVLYAPFRFGLDFLREVDTTYGGLTPAHYSSVAALGIGVALLLYARRHGHTPLPPSLAPDSAQPWPPAKTTLVASRRAA